MCGVAAAWRLRDDRAGDDEPPPARLRVSGFFAGVSLLIITVGVYFLINNIPVAAPRRHVR